MPRCLIAALLATVSGAALAQGAPSAANAPEVVNAPGAPETTERPRSAEAAPSIRSSLGRFGDPGGVNSALERYGLTYSLTYIGEGLGLVSGGFRRGGIYEGRLDIGVDADLEKLLGWSGGKIHANAFQIHGEGLSRYHVGNLFVASGIEALPSTRLYEAWFEQRIGLGESTFRVGQLAGDTEFIVSQYGGLFVNSSFGWPAITGANLPAGGPAYPLATPGARLKLAPDDSFTLQLGAFSGNPAPALRAGGPLTDPQRRNRTGTSFTLGPGLFGIAEAAFSYNGAKDAAGLPGTVKVGGWFHTGRFDDLRFTGTGGLIVDPDGPGTPGRKRGNDGIYGIIDQLIYRPAGTEDAGVGVFARVSLSPSDRNLVEFYADGGVTFKGLIPGRPDDTFGFGIGYAQLSAEAAAFDRDLGQFTGAFSPVRSSEVLLEATYQATVVPGWTVQPDLQYVVRPGGGILDPRDASGTRTIGNALIVGLRSTVRY